MVVISLLLVLSLIWPDFECFNFDLKSPVYKHINNKKSAPNFEEETNVLFGYSVAQHMLKATRTPFILVGAPKDSVINNGITYNTSGAVYKCPISLDKSDDCEQVVVDFESKKSDEVSKDFYLDEILKEQFKGRIFDNQWFGVSLASTGSGGFSACAHKYVHYYNFTNRDEHASYGACYRFSNDFMQEYKHVPCLEYSHEVSEFYFNNYAYCQAGTSLFMMDEQTLLPSNAQDTFLSYGMPGALNFRGLVGVKALNRLSSSEYLYKNRSHLCKFDIENDNPVPPGFCPNLWDKFSYTGMSHVLITRYMNKDKVNLIAAGAPRESLYGVVRFFTIMFDVSFGQVTKLLSTTLSGGKQKGSYFGFSIAACDLNGDKMDDLIVGAPYFSRKHEPNAGAIYIYLNNKEKGFTDSYVLNFTGEIRSLFGHSISCLGDIDKDGFNDFSVGAPYESGQITKKNPSYGSVYIYRGNKDMEKIKLSQKINAKDVAVSSSEESTLRAFGYSLSGGLDMDSNSYPDLVIGALNSNAIVLLRTQPIIHLNAFVVKNENLQEIDQKVKQCKKDKEDSELNAVCFNFEVCFEVVKTGGANSIQNFPLLNYTLAGDALYSRVFFNETNTNVQNGLIQIHSNKKSCKFFEVIIKQENTDFLRPIKFNLEYQFLMLNDSPKSINLSDIKNYPLVHQDSNSLEFEANFKKDCGVDKKCITDLSLQAEFVNLMTGDDNLPVLSFKESDSVTVAILLENIKQNAEPAYATEILIQFDERLDFIRKLEDEPSGFSCALSSKSKSNLLECRMTKDTIDIPFSANHFVKFNLTFSSQRLYRYANLSSKTDIRFEINAKTLSTDLNLTNNNVSLIAKLKVRANLFLYGRRTPEQVFFSDKSIIRGASAMKNFEQIGPIIEHTYIINNGGPFSVNFFQLEVDWPYESRLVDFESISKSRPGDYEGKYLLYLTEKPTKIPNNHPIDVVCNSYTVDPLKLETRAPLFKKRSIESETKSPIVDSTRTKTIDCFSNTAFCFKINCSFYGDFSKDEFISLKFTARLWNSTLVEDFSNYEKVYIKSHGKIILSSNVHDDKISDNENSVSTIAYSNIAVKVEKTLSLWIIILSVFIGLVLLVLLIVAFWAVGFFERKKFGDEKYIQESEKVKKTPY